MASVLLLQKQSSAKINYAFKQSLIKSQATSALLSKNPTELLQSFHMRTSSLCKSKLKDTNSNHSNLHPSAASQHLKMYVTIDTKWVTTLRQLIMNTFKGVVSSIRIEPINHAKKMKVCLCFTGPVEDRLMASIIRTLPSAEFGRISAA